MCYNRIAMFVHLHTHSYFSFLDAVPTPADLARAAAQNQMPALALTDHHGLTGSIAFHQACQQEKIQPIFGVEIFIKLKRFSAPLVLLAESLNGWANLCKLSSAVQTAPHREPGRGISFETLEANNAGLICLTGGRRGPIDRWLQQNDPEEAVRLLSSLAEIFVGRLYTELNIHTPADNRRVQDLVDISRSAGIPIVATNNVHFLDKADHKLQRLLYAIQTNRLLNEIPAQDYVPMDAHFASAEDMHNKFREFPEALTATLEITNRCEVKLPLGVPHFPKLKLREGRSAIDVLAERVNKGVITRYGHRSAEIDARIEHELTIIENLGYAPLFLIMAEILEFARAEGVPTASRGSAASSLVAHCLGITTPDPMEHNLYFERFLNPARKSPPDIDTDLCSTRREKILQHVYQHYGEQQVAMVATINRFRLRSALREVAKACGIEPARIAQWIESLPSRGWGPRAQPSKEPYAELKSRFPSQRSIFEAAASVLNFPRHLSVHPGGIVISPGPMTDLVPLHLASKGLTITQFDLEAVQAMGLVKIDLLGTRGLSVLGDVAEQVQSWNRGQFPTPLNVLDAIPGDDKKTAAMVNAAVTIGCFQIESPGMRATLREVQAASPQDILVALALYRPGPMTGGLKDAFVQRHLGQAEAAFIHPALQPLLSDTYGVILYQEQVLQIASELAGLSLADADLLRRAMSHFDPGERMKTLKARFIAGAQEKSRVPREKAEQIWEMMAAFAGYGFPKAHAASYAQVAWQSAWCKAHYPAEFLAAVLANWGGYYRQPIYLNEARRLGLNVKPPHINHSGPEFKAAYPKGESVLYMGLNQVRELTTRSIQRILRQRPFRTLDDFLTRVDPRPQEVENLIKIGAFTGLGTIPTLLARVKHGGWRKGQPFLFEMPLPFGTSGEWSLDQRLQAQREILGVPVEAHPLDLISENKKSELGVVEIAEALRRTGEKLRVLGVRETLQRFFHAGQVRYVLELSDQKGLLPVVFSDKHYSQIRHILKKSKPLIVSGKIVEDPLWQMNVMHGEQIAEFR